MISTLHDTPAYSLYKPAPPCALPTGDRHQSQRLIPTHKLSLDFLQGAGLLKHALVRRHASIELPKGQDLLAHVLPLQLATQQLHRPDGGTPSLELTHPVADLGQRRSYTIQTTLPFDRLDSFQVDSGGFHKKALADGTHFYPAAFDETISYGAGISKFLKTEIG